MSSFSVFINSERSSACRLPQDTAQIFDSVPTSLPKYPRPHVAAAAADPCPCCLLGRRGLPDELYQCAARPEQR